MTGTTHQIVALVAALWLLTIYPVSLGPVLGILAVVSVMAGALTPDLDQPAANIFRRMIGGKLVHRLFSAFSGGHRHFTHSFIGIIAIALVLRWLILQFIQEDFHSRAFVLWLAFMVGYISHPIADTLTVQGVPWLWPLRWNIKIPPGHKSLRVTTGSFVEMVLLRGALVCIAVLLLAAHREHVLAFFRL